MSGGLSTYTEDFRDDSLYFCKPMPLSFFGCIFSLEAHYHVFPTDHAVLVMDFSTGFTFPVKSSDPLMTTFPMGDSAEGTQQGASWWDGNSYIYK